MAKKGNLLKNKGPKKPAHQGYPKPRMFCHDGISPCNPAAKPPGFCKTCGG